MTTLAREDTETPDETGPRATAELGRLGEIRRPEGADWPAERFCGTRC